MRTAEQLFRQGYSKEWLEGYRKGYKEGIRIGIERVALGMLRKGICITLIAEYTGLSLEAIKDLTAVHA